MSHSGVVPVRETFTVKSGDRLPPLQIPLKTADGLPKDLTGVDPAHIKLVIAPCIGGRRAVSQDAMTIFGHPFDGIVQYAWPETPLPVGEYMMEVILRPGTSSQESFPSESYYKLQVLPRL